MKGVTRLTPIVPGEAQPVLWIDDTIKTGFVSGGPTEGRGFPQWAQAPFSSEKVHYFGEPTSDGIVVSLCDRQIASALKTFSPGNFGRCKVCERMYTKALRAGRKL